MKYNYNKATATIKVTCMKCVGNVLPPPPKSFFIFSPSIFAMRRERDVCEFSVNGTS